MYTCAADTQSPSPFTLSFSNVGTDNVDLSWTTSTDNVGVTVYEVTLIAPGAQPQLNYISTTGTTINIDKLSPGVTYNFYITAKDAANNSTKSNTLPVETDTTPSPGTGGSITKILLPPTHINGILITGNNKDNCYDVCWPYFEEHILNKVPLYAGEVTAHQYLGWLDDTYGPSGLEKFWRALEYALFYDPTKSLEDNLQKTLDLLGMIPVVGEPVDGINAAIYYYRGDTTNAIISATGMVPVLGNGIVALRLTNRYIDTITALKGSTIIEKTADEVNAIHRAAGRTDPYKVGTQAYEFTTTQSTQFVRVHNEANQARSWMMKLEDVKDSNGNYLTTSQIAEKFALPSIPSQISNVNVPAGTQMRMGTVGPQKWTDNGPTLQGGATQYEVLMDYVPPTWFSHLANF